MLRERQTALVLALLDGGPLPAGFAPGALAVATHVVAHKRALRFATSRRRRRGWLIRRFLGALVAWLSPRL
jgi:hypothetical protein